MLPRVYLETTTFSFYHDERTSQEIAVMRKWTREFWDQRRDGYEMVTSVAVLDELSRGTLPHRDRAFAMARGVTILPYVPEILESIEVYVMRKVMPAYPFGDAAHLAFASHYKCDFLLTWNCAHLANANKFGHIRAVNQLLGPSVPALVTPLELLFPPAA